MGGQALDTSSGQWNHVCVTTDHSCDSGPAPTTSGVNLNRSPFKGAKLPCPCVSGL